MAPLADKSMTASESRTHLAVGRTRLAYERTMMAWVRTATSLIIFGFSIYKFFQIEMGKGEVKGERPHRCEQLYPTDDQHRAVVAVDGHAGASTGSRQVKKAIPEHTAVPREGPRGIDLNSWASCVHCSFVPTIA